jgi:hypothetical protein
MLVVMLGLIPGFVFGDEAAQILHDADSFRLPNGSVRVETDVRQYRNNKLDKERRYTVYIKPQRRSLVLMKSPLEVGQKVLMLGDKFWLLTIDSQRPLRITASQKLLGEASTGDIANMTWSEDYVTQNAEDVICPQLTATISDVDVERFLKPSECIQLNLIAKVDGVTYSNITLYIEKKHRTPIKADLFVNSGKKAKEAWYAKLNSSNDKYIDTMVLIDNIQSTHHTVINYNNIEPKECPDEFFNPAALIRNTLPGW